MSVSSMPGSTVPLPATVAWTTPSVALTSSVEVRAELVAGAPSCVIAKMMMAAAAAASSATYHRGTTRLLRCWFMKPESTIAT